MKFDQRTYQDVAMNSVRDAYRRGARRVLLVSPTGSGKTVILSRVIAASILKSSRVLVLCPRREIVTQTSQKLDAIGVDHGIWMSTHPRWRPELPVQVASIATIISRISKGVAIPPADLIIVDEAHHSRCSSITTIVGMLPSAYVLGPTATPWRGDGRGLAGTFDEVVVAARPAELIEQGFLVPFDGFGYLAPEDESKIDDVSTTAGDYNELELGKAMNTRKIIGDIIGRWKETAGNARTIAFAIDVAHSEAIVADFRAAGVPSEHVDSSTPTMERDAILERLRVGTTRVVSSCGVLSEGWDCPAAEVAILARPTKSVVLALQQPGRVMRPACRACGLYVHPAATRCTHCGSTDVKRRARLHDHAGMFHHHGLPDDDRDYSLTADRKKAKVATTVKQCPTCLRFCSVAAQACPHCKHAFRGAGEMPEIENIAGQEVPLEEIRRLRRATVEEKAGEYTRLLEFAKLKGMKKGWASHKYREKFGVWPKFAKGVLDDAPATYSPLPVGR